MTKTRAIAPPMRPLTLFGHFVLTETALEVNGRPSFDEYQAAGEFINRAHRASGFWMGDWLRYGEKREDWRERLSQAHGHTGLSEKTLKNVRAVAGSVDKARRRDGVEFGVHAEVAALEPDEQSEWLTKAEENGWTVRELRLEIRAAKRRKVIEGQAVLEGMYRVIYADPPWLYGDRPPSGSGAQQHYPGMTIEQLCRLPVEAHALPNSVLFLWTTSPMICASPGPADVITAWGFTYKTGMVWDKVRHGFGHYVDVRHEHLLIATRGRCTPDRPTPMIDSIVVEQRSDVHSQKPETFRRIIERLYDGPYLELFARERTAGWTAFGNDAKLWHQDVKEQGGAPLVERETLLRTADALLADSTNG